MNPCAADHEFLKVFYSSFAFLTLVLLEERNQAALVDDVVNLVVQIEALGLTIESVRSAT